MLKRMPELRSRAQDGVAFILRSQSGRKPLHRGAPTPAATFSRQCDAARSLSAHQ